MFGIFIIVGSANAVNLTDGLDGLAIVPVMIVALTFSFIAYVSGNINFSEYLQINYIEGSGELSVFCGAIVGSALGFLLYIYYISAEADPESEPLHVRRPHRHSRGPH